MTEHGHDSGLRDLCEAYPDIVDALLDANNPEDRQNVIAGLKKEVEDIAMSSRGTSILQRCLVPDSNHTIEDDLSLIAERTNLSYDRRNRIAPLLSRAATRHRAGVVLDSRMSLVEDINSSFKRT